MSDIETALTAAFGPDEVKYKPAVVAGSRCLAMPYVDSRTIMDRLDSVFGVAGWQDEYDPLPDGSVVCRLRVFINDTWIAKTDVGGQSEQPDEGDRRKAAFSDALKRAAVKFGIGRYLYRMDPQWVDYDPQKKKIVKAPVMPAKVAGRIAAKMPQAQTSARPAAQAAGNGSALPADGAELLARLATYEERLAAVGLCGKGELLAAVTASGVRAGFGPELASWTAAAIAQAVEWAKTFEAGRRGRTNGKVVTK